ncbi:hypothetical protein IP88_10190 [alpha proteobacterium AAP81b]|nr:hypothetical protein IP88_10190 [alpha proteobacterium AAP81b]
MADDLLDALAPVLTRWTIGGDAAPAAPPAWAPALGSDSPELRLLAIAGHILGGFVVPTPATPLRNLPDLPALALPTVSARLRPLLRRLLAGADARQRRIIIGFVAARGRVMHPADWLPPANDDALPDVYAPWRDWAAACAAGGPARSASGELSEATWDDFGPAARDLALGLLRRRDPAAARALIAAKLPTADADGRLRLVIALATGLGADDRPLLESLGNDRAPRVKTQVAILLARLGVGEAAGAEMAELAGFFEIQTRGLLRRTRHLVPRPIKTPAQTKRRGELLDAADFAGFAAALGLTATELAELWSFDGDVFLAARFVAVAARSADDAVITALHAALAARPSVDFAIIAALQPRLTTAQTQALLRPALLSGGPGTLAAALDIAGADPRFDDILRAPAFAAILGDLARDGRAAMPADLWALGLLASPAAARGARDRLVAAGLAAADPRLDSLRLNIMLDEEGRQ